VVYLKTIVEDKKIIVFLSKDEVNDICFEDDEFIEKYFKDLFLKLNKKYDIELNGYYDVKIYKDVNYGAVIEFINEDIDYYNYFDQIDMKINISKSPLFLYEINYNFLDSEILKKSVCYKFLNKLYLKLNDIDNDYFKLLELSDIVYGNKVEEILKYGKKVKL